MINLTKKTAQPRLPVVYFTPEAKEKMYLYTLLAEGEISGLGEVQIVNSTDFLVYEIHLLKQVCTPVETNLDRKDIASLVVSMMDQKKNPANLKLWWHSHVEMPVYWSFGTDERTIQGFRNKWMLSVVGNKFGDMLARVDLYDPVRLTVDNLPVRVLDLPSEELKQELALEVAEKVTFLKKVMTSDGQDGGQSGSKHKHWTKNNRRR